MIAAQATELSRAEGGGAAWAAALAGDDARRLAGRATPPAQGRDGRAGVRSPGEPDHRGAGVGRAARGGANHVYESSMKSMSRVAASRAAPTPAIIAAAVAPGAWCKPPSAAPSSRRAPSLRHVRHVAVIAHRWPMRWKIRENQAHFRRPSPRRDRRRPRAPRRRPRPRRRGQGHRRRRPRAARTGDVRWCASTVARRPRTTSSRPKASSTASRSSGAGTLVPGVRTRLARFVAVDPLALAREAAALRALGVDDAAWAPHASIPAASS